ncbi:MAG: glycerophosphodiester phosphodiesterase family protein [Geminicoccaceae bacterium]
MVQIVGHRGGRNVWPENSLLGFRKVQELAVDAVEFDVHLTRAGELLVIHDPTLERTTLGTGKVAELAPGAHRDVVLRDSEGETIPTLVEVLEVFRDAPLDLHIELKSDGDHVPYPGIVDAVVAVLAGFDFGRRAMLTSFDPDVLGLIRDALPCGRRLCSIDRASAERLGGLARAVRHFEPLVEVVAIQKDLMREHWAAITAVVEPGRLAAWTVNDEADIDYWLGQPIRSITSDRPDLAVAVKGRRGG